MIRSGFAAAAFAALLTAGCNGGVVDPSQNQSQTLTGTVQPGGIDVQTFSVSKSGEFFVTVSQVTPTLQSGATFTIVFGQPTSGVCAPVQTTPYGRVGNNLLSGAIQPGSYCIAVVDQGFFTQAETYTMTVQHP